MESRNKPVSQLQRKRKCGTSGSGIVSLPPNKWDKAFILLSTLGLFATTALLWLKGPSTELAIALLAFFIAMHAFAWNQYTDKKVDKHHKEITELLKEIRDGLPEKKEEVKE